MFLNKNEKIDIDEEKNCKSVEIEAMGEWPDEKYNEDSYRVKLSVEEKVKCLDEIIVKLKKILYVYDKTLEPNSTYNYKIYCGGILIYVSSSNILFNGELVNIVVNLNAILTNKFSKSQIKRIVFETINFAQYISSKYKNELDTIIYNEEKG